ncbi:MAG TPA: glycosyltransferase family 1 protein [candidate division Zixibacteria bacterium]|nr:glycosyltransferase family 1 protein [candidate division Zixibacteria bacterium]
MKLAVEASILARPLAGVGVYTRSLVSAMAELDDVEEIVLFSIGDVPEFASPKVRTVRYRSRVQHFAIQLELPKLLKNNGIDVLHGPNFYLPLRGKTPSAVTVHDLSAQFFPSHHSLKHRLSQAFLKPSIKRADAIIAVSKATADEIARYRPSYAGKVRVVHNGVDERFTPAPLSEIECIRVKFGLPERFILFVGTLEPRKNVQRLVEAFAEIRHRVPQKLIIAGGKGWLYDDIFASVRQLGIEDSVMFIGYVPFEDLPALYSSADVFCYPSLYEGFGLPVLEAMACGTPVVTSNLSSMPEVAGDCAILVDPSSAESIADGLRRLAQDDALREDFKARGLARAKEFTWQNCARKTLDIYRSIV